MHGVLAQKIWANSSNDLHVGHLTYCASASCLPPKLPKPGLWNVLLSFYGILWGSSVHSVSFQACLALSWQYPSFSTAHVHMASVGRAARRFQVRASPLRPAQLTGISRIPQRDDVSGLGPDTVAKGLPQPIMDRGAGTRAWSCADLQGEQP